MNLSANSVARKSGPWNLFQTLGLGIIVAVTFVGIQILALLMLVNVEMSHDESRDVSYLMARLATQGSTLSLMTTAAALICIPMVLFMARARKTMPVRDYLLFHGVALRQLIFWIAMVVLYAIAWEGMAQFMDRPGVPDIMLNAYATAGNLPLFWFALVIAAPLFEEIFFRGFLFTGIRQSALGPVGAVLITSATWAAIHVQYDLYDIATIFVFGLILGVAVLRSRSLLVPVLLHSLMNLAAVTQIALMNDVAGQ